MKLSLFAVAMLGFTAVNAVTLSTYENEVIDADLAEVEADHCNTVKVNIPECQGKPDPDSLIMEAVAELGDKSKDMAQALKLAFARSARLAATRTMEVKGCISLTPKINEPEPAGKPSTVNISGGSGCGCGGTQLQITPPVCK